MNILFYFLLFQPVKVTITDILPEKHHRYIITGVTEKRDTVYIKYRGGGIRKGMTIEMTQQNFQGLVKIKL